ncbi:MAG TPA: cohesin domain-containing protein [Terriglobales bacterium]
MRVFGRFAAALLTVFLLLPIASAETSSSLYNKGKKAEARQDYEAAYEFYKQAYDQKPQELRYRVKYERLRFLAAASHVHRGQQLRDDGKLQEALAQFEQAAQIDASSSIARQEAQRTREMIQSQGQGAAPAAQPSAEPKPDMLHKRIEEAQGPIDLAPIQDQALVMHLSGDSKTMYQTIGKLAGINVLFDPDYQSRQMPALDLNGVTLQQALEMIALQSSTFWRPVTANTIFVAADTPAKRKQLEQNVIKTFYLSNYSQPSDLQDIVSILRQILDAQRVLPNNSQGAVIIRGTPDQVAMAEKIVEDFDKAKPEVIVEVAIMQVRRDKLRNLGFQPPTSAAIQLKPATSNVTTNPTNPSNPSGQPATPTNTGSLTLNDFKNLNANNFQVTIPQATLDFLFSDSNSKLLQNPQIRASDGLKATLKIGDRIPVATGSFQPGIGGVGINPLVNTQFQYLDVGVNIDITPRVHANREVSLKVALDISSQTGTTNIGGIQQPIISQRKVEHDLRLREGEVSLLGGIFEDTDTHSISGIPGLAQIPILRYFFGRDSVEHVENEVVFVLIPHVVRGFDINEFNTKPIDVGTGNAIDLRMGVTRQPGGTQAPPSQPPPTTPQSSVMPGGPMNGRPPGESARAASPRPASESIATGAAPALAPGSGQPAQVQGGAQPAPGAAAPVSGTQSSTSFAGSPGAPVSPAGAPATAAADVGSTNAAISGPAALKFDPATVTTSANGTFSVNVVLSGGHDVYSVPIQITYDPKHLQLVNITSGELLSRDNQPIALAHRDDNGLLVASATRPPGSAGVSGDGAVFTLTWQAKAPGNSVLSITRPGARNSAQQPIPVMGSQMTVSVR